MKKIVYKNIIFIALFVLMSFTTAYATNVTGGSYKVLDKSSYDVASTNIRNEINQINDKIKNYTKYKDEVLAKANLSINGTTEVTPENQNKIKELIKNIPKDLRKEKTLTADSSISTLVKNEAYDKALEKLQDILTDRKKELNEIEKSIEIFKQIDKLLE